MYGMTEAEIETNFQKVKLTKDDILTREESITADDFLKTEPNKETELILGTSDENKEELNKEYNEVLTFLKLENYEDRKKHLLTLPFNALIELREHTLHIWLFNVLQRVNIEDVLEAIQLVILSHKTDLKTMEDRLREPVIVQ